MKALLILFIVFVDAEGVCRNGWVRFENSCYLFITNQKATWTTAMGYCRAAHGHLAEVDGRDENEFIRNHLLDMMLGDYDDFWIGGEDFEQEGYWVWADRGTKITQTFWAPGEPNSDGEENCINLLSKLNYYWNDDACDFQSFFVCEMEDYQTIIG